MIGKQTLRQRLLTVLNQTQIASPCEASWDQMTGDEKVRLCPSCSLNVYNLSAMDVEDAADLLNSHEGRLCVRFYRRADGTILTRDCPQGTRSGRKRRGNQDGQPTMGLRL